MDAALHEPTCRVRRHAHVHHLLTADESSLVELETALAVLPICAAGRVFVEVPDASWVRDLDAPARMVMTWLDRSSRRSQPGDAVTRAATAWAGEMLCGGDDSDASRVLLLGAAAPRIAAQLADCDGVDAASIHVFENDAPDC